MSDEREKDTLGGAPVEDAETTTSELRAAVERATDGTALPEPVPALAPDGVPGESPREAEPAPSAFPAPLPDAELPSAAAPVAAPGPAPESGLATEAYAVTPDAADPALTGPEPSTGQVTVVGAAVPDRPDEIRVAADHPMAPLYVQTPAPPENRGNRGVGILISLLGTLGFAAVYAGGIALFLAPTHAPSQFLGGLQDHLFTLGFLLPIAAFFVMMVLIVLIVNRAGWWAYVLGGFLVAVAVWAAATVGWGLTPAITGVNWGVARADLLGTTALTPLPLIAAVVAREASVWFGAWIGARGRRMKRRNAEALAAYEEQVAANQAGTLAGL
ncbi:hypothetical protein [Leucobacter sp. M11]|uniref:hypothetical protein n=1 Tax=Leucobacter sp. M11 TaxID=2993565 RepID=UPI002D7EFDA1|nr:hypothetical protein [Leucobacter sp. M11]MEB4614336.1 hypothetical protein [Leucobacter sp. M11]